MENYSELLYTRKPKLNRVISKQKIQEEKGNEEANQESQKEQETDLESQALEILNNDEDEKNEIEELMTYLKEKSKGRIQKAKIFYKNLKFNFELLEESNSDDESDEDAKSKKKIKRIKNRVINDALQDLNK